MARFKLFTCVCLGIGGRFSPELKWQDLSFCLCLSGDWGVVFSPELKWQGLSCLFVSVWRLGCSFFPLS